MVVVVEVGLGVGAFGGVFELPLHAEASNAGSTSRRSHFLVAIKGFAVTFNHIRQTVECKSVQRCRLRFFETPWCILPRLPIMFRNRTAASVDIRMTAAQGIPDRLVVSAEERLAALLDVIRQARSRITLSLFRCNDQAVFDALQAAAGRGVAVEVLVTSRAKGGKKKMAKLWRALEQTGASLHVVHRSGGEVSPEVSGRGRGAGDRRVAEPHEEVLPENAATRSSSPTTRPSSPVCAGSGPLTAAAWRCRRTSRDRLIVGPERARRQFTALIEGARTSIRLIDAKLSDPDLVSLLNAKRAAGMTVELFSCKQVGDLKSHGKIMLLDDETVVVGSLALAALSLDFRREVAIVVTEPVGRGRGGRAVPGGARRGGRRRARPPPARTDEAPVLIAACLSALAVVSTPRLAAAPVPCSQQSADRAGGRSRRRRPRRQAKTDRNEQKPRKQKRPKKNKVPRRTRNRRPTNRSIRRPMRRAAG